jgi:TolB protein
MHRVLGSPALVGAALVAAAAALGFAPAPPRSEQRHASGQQIIFARSVGRNGPNLYLMNDDGTAQHVFVRNADAPAVSSDDRSIAFTRRGEVWAMRRDGSGQHRVTRPQRGWGPAWRPVWSPDGRTIYFGRDTRSGSAGSALFAVRADGTGYRELTQRKNCDSDPTASPDGHVLAFGRILGDCAHGDGGTLCAIDLATGSILRPFPFPHPDEWLYEPAWSPDGRHLAFVSRCDPLSVDDPYTSPCYRLYISERHGRVKVLLTSSALGKGGDYGTPAWSRDGARIAYTVEGDEQRIWVIDADGSGNHRLTAVEGSDADPAWLPSP